MVQIGAAHEQHDLDGALVQIVDTLDLVKSRCEAVAQWAAMQTAADLATKWNIQQADAQVYLDACATFGAMVANALAADPKLGPLAASIRNVSR